MDQKPSQILPDPQPAVTNKDEKVADAAGLEPEEVLKRDLEEVLHEDAPTKEG